MTKILTDLTSNQLVEAIQNNLYDLVWALRDHWRQARFEANEKLVRWWTPIPLGFVFNAALSMRPPGPDETDLIEETIHFFQTGDRKAFDWWLKPGLETSDWCRQLEARGLSLEQDPPGMAIDLASLPDSIDWPTGLKIDIVSDPQRMITWTQTFLPGYEIPLDWESHFQEMMLALLKAPTTSYLATIDDQPVATAMLFHGAGVAGIYNIATLPEWRGKGIGAAMTLQPLLDACRQGYRAGILQSSEMGYRIYQRLGFKKLCTLNHYRWKAQPD